MPNPGLPEWKKAEVIRRLFSGSESRDEAAGSLVGTGSVTSIKEEFIQRAEVVGLTAAADQYGVRELVEALLELSKAVSKEGVSVEESKSGIEILSLAEQNDVSRAEIPSLVRACSVAVKHPRPEGFFDAAEKIARDVKKSGMSYDDVVLNQETQFEKIRLAGDAERAKTLQFNEKERAKTKREGDEERKQTQHVTFLEQEKIKKLGRKKQAMEADITKAEHRLSQVEEKTKTAEVTFTKRTKECDAKINDATRGLDKIRAATKDILARADRVEEMVGLFEKSGVKNPEDQVKLLQEIERLGGDAGRIVALLNEYGGLHAAIGTTSKRLAALETAVNRLHNETETRKKELEETNSILSTFREELSRKQQELQASKERLRSLRKRVARIESTGETLKEMRGTISSRKNLIHQLDENVAKLESDFKALVNEIAEANGIKADIDSVKKSLKTLRESLAKARSDGVTEKTSILTETESVRRALSVVKQELTVQEQRFEVTMKAMHQIAEILDKPGFLRVLADCMNNRTRPIDDKYLVAVGITFLDFLTERVKASAIRSSWKMTSFLPSIEAAKKALKDVSDELLRS